MCRALCCIPSRKARPIRPRTSSHCAIFNLPRSPPLVHSSTQVFTDKEDAFAQVTLGTLHAMAHNPKGGLSADVSLFGYPMERVLLGVRPGITSDSQPPHAAHLPASLLCEEI